jgi:hypothetical protein
MCNGYGYIRPIRLMVSTGDKATDTVLLREKKHYIMADKQFKRTGRLFIYHFLLHEHATAADLLPVWACWCFFFFFF